MGVFKKYAPAIASDALRNNAMGGDLTYFTDYAYYSRTVPTWYDVDGNQYTNLFGCPKSYSSSYDSFDKNYVKWYINNIQGLAYSFFSMANISVIATSDALENYDVYDYDITTNALGDVTFNKNTVNTNLASDFIWSVRIANNSEEAFTIKCIKFTKSMAVCTTSSGNTPNAALKKALYCAYFLDEEEWITIPAGESRNIVVDFAAIVA